MNNEDMFPDFAIQYFDSIRKFFDQMTGEWVVYQLLAIAFGIACSYLFTRTVSRRIEKFLDGADGHWLRAWKREILERIAPLIFLVAIWLCLISLREITWIGNTVVLGTVAKLTTAWIVINVLASVIRNRFFFRVVSMSLWIIAALSILRLLPSVTSYLDTTAFQIGDTRLSALRALKAIGVIAVLIWGVGFISRLIERGLKNSTDITASMKVLIGKLVRLLLTLVAIVAGLNVVGIDLTVFAVFSGAIGVGVGFGLQKTVSNFFSGISLLLDKSIKPGDVITVGDTYGHITQLNTRFTSVVTPDGREHLIPNEVLVSQEVINWSHSSDTVRISIPFGISYQSDPHQVQSLIEEAITRHPRVQRSPKPVVHFEQFGESSLDLRARVWIKDPGTSLATLKSELNFLIWDVLKANDIEIPYAKRDLYAPDGISIRLQK